MAKRCECHAVLEMLERDPRLRALPLAPRMLWFALVRAMQGMGASVLRLGSVVPNPAELALLVAVSETELLTHLEPILARGLLVRCEDGALVSPMLEAVEKRANTARANGAKGGRPRSRQREMLLPIPGDGAVVETQAEPRPGAAGSAAIAKPEVGGVKLAADVAAWRETGDQVLEIMGVDRARSPVHAGIVRQWLADGASPALILRVVTAKMRPGVQSPGYFTDAIRDAMRKPAERAELGARSRAFDAAMQAWCEGGKVGGMPAPTWFDERGMRVAA